MVKPYRETPEDRLLTRKPFSVWRGLPIDTRWSGGWLTPGGEYFPVDYARGVTHETIAENHGERIHGSGSVMTCPPIMRLFDIAGWMRITYFEYSSFCVELKGKLRDRAFWETWPRLHRVEKSDGTRQLTLAKFVRDFSGFEEYYLNDKRFDTFKKFQAGIWNDDVDPRSDSAGRIEAPDADRSP